MVSLSLLVKYLECLKEMELFCEKAKDNFQKLKDENFPQEYKFQWIPNTYVIRMKKDDSKYELSIAFCAKYRLCEAMLIIDDKLVYDDNFPDVRLIHSYEKLIEFINWFIIKYYASN